MPAGHHCQRREAEALVRVPEEQGQEDRALAHLVQREPRQQWLTSHRTSGTCMSHLTISPVSPRNTWESVAFSLSFLLSFCALNQPLALPRPPRLRSYFPSLSSLYPLPVLRLRVCPWNVYDHYCNRISIDSRVCHFSIKLHKNTHACPTCYIVYRSAHVLSSRGYCFYFIALAWNN